jgi:PAS domain S-box-containing protein
VLSVSLPSNLAIEEEKALVKEVTDDIAFALSGIELEAERRRMEDSLRENETFFLKAFSASPLPVCIASVETGEIIKVNDGFCRIFGYGGEELVGRSTLKLGMWNTPEDRRKFVGKLKEQGSVQGMPFDVRTKCGDSIKAMIFAESFDFKGESCILSTFIDLTHRNDMEKMLEESTRLYKELTDSIGDVFFAMDKDLRCTYWNKASERLTGIKADYAIGRSLFELFPENEESNATKAYKKALATGTEQTFLNEYRIKDKDYFFEITAYPSERGLSVFVKDVTVRMKAETELALSESRYRRLFDYMSSGVAVYEARDNGTRFVIKDINIAGQRIENVRREEIIGRCVSEVFPGVKEFGLFDVFKRVWETGVPEHFHAALYKDDRISGWRDNFVYRLPSGEIVAVYEDVTDRVTTEKTKEAVFDISEATISTSDIKDLYVRIHRILEGLMPVRNIFIALHDALTDTLSFPYFVDEHDLIPAPRKAGRGLTEYVLRSGRPLLASAQDIQELSDRGEIDIIGTIPVCWVGVPLLIEGHTIGVVVMQSYDEEFEYVERDRDILTFVSNEVAMAIERKNAEKALKESEEKYRNCVEKANDGITIIQDGVVRYTNPKLAEMGGYTIEETIGKPFTDFVWPEDVVKLADHHKRRMRGEKVPNIYEARLRGKGGECLYVELNTTVMEYEGGPADFTIVRDLSCNIQAQEALRRSEQKYRMIFETTGTAMIMIEKDRTISLANEEVLNLTGYSKEEIEGRMKVEDFVADEDIKRIMKYHDLRRKDAGLAPHGYETNIKNKKGEVRTVWVTIDVIPETKQSVASLIDTTEVKKLERKLSEKSQEQTLLLDNIETMVWYATDPETYGMMNRARAEFIGLKKEEMEGKKIWDILPTQEAKLAVMGNRIAFKEKRTYRGDEWVTTARGEKRCVAVTKIPKLDADGNVQFVVCTGHDITESRMLEKELHDKSNEQALLLDNIQTMVYFATDPETHGKLNQARADFYGKSIEEMEGRKIGEIMPKDRADIAIAGNRYVFETKKPYHGLEWHTNWKGEKHLFSVTKVPKLDEKGNVEFVICSAHDVTDLEEAQNALSLANKKLNLLGSVTRHDILNQLTVITSGLDMAEGIVKEVRARMFMDMALNASRSIEKYLEFSRDYERMGTTKPEWIDAKEACMKGMSTLETGDVNLTVELDGLEIYADKLLEKVFHNLIGNALKHGGRVSTVHVYSKSQDGHMVLVCEDDGNGIPKDKKGSILEGGHGRGLYLVKEILGITGMTINEIGEEGRGARFEISIPEGNYRMMKSASSE